MLRESLEDKWTEKYFKQPPKIGILKYDQIIIKPFMSDTKYFHQYKSLEIILFWKMLLATEWYFWLDFMYKDVMNLRRLYFY